MKTKQNFLIYPLLIMGIFLVFASSCKKDDDGNNTFTDPRDGIVYKTVTIGKQVWMAENLKYLPSVVLPSTGSNTTPYYYVYNYYGTNVNGAKATAVYTTYGVLYNWPAAMNGAASSTANPSGVKGVCPPGWHLPSKSEWTQLIDYLDGSTVAGGKLKEEGTVHWNNPNTGATNSSGFTAFGGGYRYWDDTFAGYHANGSFWSSTDFTINPNFPSASYLSLLASGSKAYQPDMDKNVGMSVRCLKD